MSQEGYILTNANGQFIRKRLLLEVEFGATTLRYVEAPTPVHADDWLVEDHRWTPYPFLPPSGLSSQVGELSGLLTIQVPVNETLYDALLTETLQNGAVRVYEAYFDPETDSQLAEETILLMEGQIDEPSFNAETLVMQFKVDAVFDLRAVFIPRRTFTRLCQFIYKGPGCQADGPLASCNHAFTATGGCEDAGTRVVPIGTWLGNQGRYGGFLSAGTEPIT